jgi:hypothetical protein
MYSVVRWYTCFLLQIAGDIPVEPDPLIQYIVDSEKAQKYQFS